jgi:uncharacterized protein YaaQ
MMSMKLIIAIVKDNDASDLIDAVINAGFRITKLATTGGFLKSGNSTLLIGVEEKNVDQVIEVINYICESKKQIETETPQVKVGGATIFVVDVNKFVKI